MPYNGNRWEWTKAELEKAKKMWEAGETSGAIGMTLGYTASGIRTKQQKEGWKVSEEGKLVKKVAFSQDTSRRNLTRVLGDPTMQKPLKPGRDKRRLAELEATRERVATGPVVAEPPVKEKQERVEAFGLQELMELEGTGAAMVVDRPKVAGNSNGAKVKAPVGRGLALEQLTSADCKWPTNDDAPFEFCGLERTGKNYCAYHEELAVRKPMVGGKPLTGVRYKPLRFKIGMVGAED